MVLVGGVTEVRGRVSAFTVQGDTQKQEMGSGLVNKVGDHLLEPRAVNTGAETGELVPRDQCQWHSS